MNLSLALADSANLSKMVENDASSSMRSLKAGSAGAAILIVVMILKHTVSLKSIFLRLFILYIVVAAFVSTVTRDGVRDTQASHYRPHSDGPTAFALALPVILDVRHGRRRSNKHH